MLENKESSYKGYTEARARANAKYISQFVEIKVRTTPEHRDAIKAHAAARGESVNGFIGRAIAETMERDNGGGTDSRADATQKPIERTDGGGATPIPPDAQNVPQAAQKRRGRRKSE